jgi:hypothetical protein
MAEDNIGNYNQEYEQRKEKETLHQISDYPLSDKESRAYINEFLRSFSINVIFLDKEGKIHTIVSPREPKEGERELPSLYVRDIGLLLDKIKIFEEENFRNVHGPNLKGNEWAIDQNGFTIWYNATPYDLLHPEQYLDAQIFQIKDETFLDITNWTTDGNPCSTGQGLFVHHFVPRGEFESPNELRFAFSEKEEPQETDNLPVVRYGRVAPDKVRIYAIQMPAIGNRTERNLYARLERAHNLANDARDYFLGQYKENIGIYKRVLGPIPKDILEIEDPEEFAVRYYDFLKNKAEKDGENNLWSWGYKHRYREGILGKKSDLSFVHDRLGDLLVDSALMLKGKSGILSALESYNLRREQLKRFNGLMKGNVPAGLRDAPPPGVISLAIALKMFFHEGIRKIDFPLYFPARMHEGNEELDKRILEQNVKIIQRVAFEVGGIEIT